MLRSQSGDLVNQLQAKIKEMTVTHERERVEMEQSHETKRKEMNDLFENQKNSMIEDYERRLRELEAKKTSEFNSMQSEL